MELGDAPIGQYRSHDPPKNFVIKVKFWRVKSGSVVPAIRHQSTLGLREGNGDEVGREALEMVERSTDDKQTEELAINWQQKFFCEREIAFYENSLNCMSALDQKYHDDIAQLSSGNGRKNKQVFTYIDPDRQIFNEESSGMTTSLDERPTILVERMERLNLKSVGRRNFTFANDQRLRLVEENPSKATKDSHVRTTPSKVMYIMADLSPENRLGTVDDEFLLCVIKIDANGQIVIKPDFTKEIPYRIETVHEAKEVYEYTLTDVSIQMAKSERERETQLLSELYDRHADVMASHTGMEFYPQPAANEMIYYVFGEIVCASNFEYDDLFVEFFIDLPPNWQSNKPSLSETTQKCSRDSNDIVNFSYPFELQLVYRCPEDGSEPFVPWPTLFLEVSSADSWQRYRKEGYGYLSLPGNAGCHMFEVPTWRPFGNGINHQMRRFFTGGAPELQDSTFVKVPTEAQGTKLSKFGFKTVSSGLVTIRMYTIIQHRGNEVTTRGRRSLKNVRNKARGLTAVESLGNILDAFHRAKRRMLAAKATLPLVS